jgi:hypothetical protein
MSAAQAGCKFRLMALGFQHKVQNMRSHDLNDALGSKVEIVYDTA